MKNFGVIIVAVLCLWSCKEEKAKTENLKVNEIEETKANEVSDGLTTIAGEFVFYDDAAILQTPTGMYAIVKDKKMHELDKLVEQYKTEDSDFVPVTIRGKINPKPENEEGWDYRIEIKEIIKIERPTKNNEDVIKLGTE